MAARGVTPAQTERSGVSRRHDAGSHSVDRIVRVILFFQCGFLKSFSLYAVEITKLLELVICEEVTEDMF